MILDFLFTKLNIVMFVFQIIIFLCVFIKLFYQQFLKNISYKYFVFAIVLSHVFYASFATFGQYAVWNKNEFTKILLTTSLTKEVVFPAYLGFLRPIFDSNGGYFIFYSFTHFFLNIIILFALTLLFILFLKIYRHTNADDISIIAISFLIAGWPRLVILILLGFIVLIVTTVLKLSRTYFYVMFLCSSLFTLIFGKSLLLYFSLWYNLNI